MIVYRLSTGKYAADLSGRGAELVGGRWNSKGVAMLYTGASRALCTAEIAVHLPLQIVPQGYRIVSIRLSDDHVQHLVESKLPAGWKAWPYIRATQLIGDEFIRTARTLALRVPSAVVPGDYNFVINPLHREFRKVAVIKTEDFEFDQRLFKR